MKIKFVKYEMPAIKKDIKPWNCMTFYNCKVLNISMQEYKAGRRMSIEIEAPKLRKKYFLYAWSDNGICEAIEKSSLKVGDYISCHTELSYYQNKDGRHCEAYKIVASDIYDARIPENERYFKLMVIKRDDQKKEVNQKFISPETLLQLMLE